MKDQKFEHLLSEIRDEHVDDKVVAQAGERVWNAIAGSSPSADLSTHRLRSCQDFQALIPQYTRKQLPEDRALLFEDHIHECVVCRHALEQSGESRPAAVWRPRPDRHGLWVWRWGMASATVIVVCVGIFALANGLLPGQHAVRGAVQTVDGSLYSVSGDEVRLVPAGYAIRSGDELRTAKGSNAVVRLLDGSLVEMGERADISVSRGWKGTTVRLDGGQVIVQAAKQRAGRLYVATDDCLVSVKGTIFSVNRGMKGSRVAVIEGVVRVEYGEHAADLHAGDEATSSGNVSKVPIQNEIAWSRNAARYLALLGDFAVLQKQFEAVPGPGLRYSSDLLQFVPDNTVVYAAIPNLATTLGEANRLFQERLQQSPALRTWWREQEKGRTPKLETLVEQIKTFNSYLGSEIVFAVGKSGQAYGAPVVLARVHQPGLVGFLRDEDQQLSAKNGHTTIQVVRDPWAGPPSGQPLLVYLNNDVMVASSDIAELQKVATRMQQSTTSRFVETPLYQQVMHAYQQGAGWLFCVDMEQIVAQNVHVASGHNFPQGIEDVRYLTVERREVGGKVDNRAALTFAAQRRGVAAWLAAPASMGSLEFVSPDASMVTSVVIQDLKNIMEDLFRMASGSPNFNQQLSEFESKTGVNVLNDITAPLGGELTMAFDGPLLPTPRWKLIVEVYDPATLQSTIAKLVESFNRESNAADGPFHLTEQQIGSQTYFTLRSQRRPDHEVDYTFVDSYFIAAPDLGTLSRAIENRQTGYTLTHSPTFQALLPSDGYTNFSGIFYHNVGPIVGPVAEQLKSSGALTAQQRQSIDALTANSAPGLIYAYGERDRIVVTSNTGFMGFDLGMLMTMGDHGPFLPQMFLGKTLEQANH